jgi:hypothetical protein
MLLAIGVEMSKIPESMREKLIGEVQDILLGDELPFKHVVIMMDDGRIIESFSLDEGWPSGILELRIHSTGTVVANLSWAMRSSD